MLQRVGNKIYESCRSQSLNLPGFPAFEPVLSALRSQNVVDRHKSYRVSAQQHDALYILEVYAKKWLATESTKERAQQVIEDHNKEFNPTEKYWMEERSCVSLSTVLSTCFLKVDYSYYINPRVDSQLNYSEC